MAVPLSLQFCDRPAIPLNRREKRFETSVGLRAGDPESMKPVKKLVEQAPQLLEAIASLIEVAEQLIVMDTAGNSQLMTLGPRKISLVLPRRALPTGASKHFRFDASPFVAAFRSIRLQRK